MSWTHKSIEFFLFVMVLYISYSACSLACIFLDIIRAPYCKSITRTYFSFDSLIDSYIIHWTDLRINWFLSSSWWLYSFCLLLAPNWSMWSPNWLVRLLKATWKQLFQINYSGLTIQELCCSWSTSCCSKLHLRLQFSSGNWYIAQFY